MNEQNPNVLDASDLRGQPVTIGRYILHRQIARGGMATIHIARLMGDEGFSRIVAAKRLHPEFAEDAEFVAMFLDEARIASKVQHRNVVPVLDVVAASDEVMLVQEYVHGVPLHWLLRSMQQSHVQMPIKIAVSIACQVLSGLHATHETVDELGVPMQIVHRDVSPQNVMVAVDGSARLLDFGVAKAIMAAHVTREGTYKGKLAYSAPEQLRGTATRQSDVYSLSVLLWELLVGQRMHRTKSGAELVSTVLSGSLPTVREALSVDDTWDSLSASDRRQLQVLDPIIRKGLAVDMKERWATAADMEEALTSTARPASASAVAAWTKSVGKDFLERRESVIAAEEASFRRVHPVNSGRSSLPANHSAVNVRLPAVEPIASEHAAPFVRKGPSPKVVLASLGGISVLIAVVLALRSPSETKSEPRLEVGARSESMREQELDAQKPARANAPRAGSEEPRLELKNAPQAREDEPAQRAEESQRDSSPRRPTVTSKDKPQRRSHPVITRPPPEPEQTAEPTPAPPARPANDCSTPYYFEGNKKIFKPACI